MGLSSKNSPFEFYEFYQAMCKRLNDIEPLDLIDLSRANSILAFEAVCGRRLVVRDPDRVAGFVSEVARQYEDDMMHACFAPQDGRQPGE